LTLHSPKVSRFIVLHDTETFGRRDQGINSSLPNGTGPGLWPAVEELLAQGAWCIREHYTNNNGLTILERIK
jgi:hypothetical protein